jgi:hypothetical protein
VSKEERNKKPKDEERSKKEEGNQIKRNKPLRENMNLFVTLLLRRLEEEEPVRLADSAVTPLTRSSLAGIIFLRCSSLPSLTI